MVSFEIQRKQLSFIVPHMRLSFDFKKRARTLITDQSASNVLPFIPNNSVFSFYQHPTIYCLDERGIIEEPYQTPNDFARKRGFIIKVLELYKWKNVPVAKVLFYDCEKYASQILDEKTFPRVWRFSPLRVPHKVERIGAYRQVGRAVVIDH